MKAIRIFTAIGVTTGLILMYPHYHTMLDAVTDIITTMFPALPVMSTFFLTALPVVVFGIMIWGGIQIAISKIHIGGGEE